MRRKYKKQNLYFYDTADSFLLSYSKQQLGINLHGVTNQPGHFLLTFIDILGNTFYHKMVKYMFCI